MSPMVRVVANPNLSDARPSPHGIYILSHFTITHVGQPEGAGLEAIAEGFRHLGFKDDHALNAAEWIVYDALHAYCEKMVHDGRPNGQFAA